MKFRPLLVGIAVAISALGACQAASAEVIVVTQPAPPATIIEHVPAPRTGFVWDSGHWHWEHHRYVWINGHWQQVRVGHRWIEGHWNRHGRDWHWSPGHWD
jgi:hypothetical protein